MPISKMTEAFKKVQNYRDRMNAGRQKILSKDLSCVVYIYNNVAGQPCAIGYRGRAKKTGIYLSLPKRNKPI